MYFGIVPPLSDIQSWLMPPILSGYMATGEQSQGQYYELSLLRLALLFITLSLKWMDKRNLGIGKSRMFSQTDCLPGH
ncbi:hypothetical protein [Photobacterium leiognathi]|uniref:hypothetical protein n=1 Tax=Photobacterium leiognathi TaxID=553611 RepID=UPI0027365D96|nr:hypothetical protein [Photobacterium leiognathi]